MKCEAFPNGIPKEELYKQRDNKSVCNNGIQYEKFIKK
jgi:hypothetical protein